MEPIGKLDEVRRVVQLKFAAQGVDIAQGLAETILIRDSHYCGRRFNCGGWRAVWFVEEGVLKFFDADGRFRENLDLDVLSAAEQKPSECAA